MTPMMTFFVLMGLIACALGGVVFAFADFGGQAKKRVQAVARPAGSARLIKGGTNPDANQQRRKNVQTMLKELEQQNAQKNKRPSLRRRIEQAGLTISIRMFWTLSTVCGVVVMLLTIYAAPLQIWVAPFTGLAFTFGFPRWVLAFLKMQREKKFTNEFAPAIETIVRSVKSGLPVNEALKVVSTEIPEPVASEFKLLVESLKVGVTIEDGLKRMYERMPTPEANFFAIVMTIQMKTGGNLSEALSNLAGVLRDRKRMQAKIRAMSSEAKAGASIIGSLPPGVAALIYFSTPNYIEPLFTTQVGNLMLIGCGVWMASGVAVMMKMVRFKF